MGRRRVGDREESKCAWCNAFWLTLPGWLILAALIWHAWGDRVVLGPPLEFEDFTVENVGEYVYSTRTSRRLRACPSTFSYSLVNGREYYLLSREGMDSTPRQVDVSDRYRIPPTIEPGEYALAVQAVSRCPFAAPVTQRWVSSNRVVLAAVMR